MRWGLCGGWTEPPLEVTTKRAPAPQRPHTIGFSQLTARSVVVTWSAAANTGGVRRLDSGCGRRDDGRGMTGRVGGWGWHLETGRRLAIGASLGRHVREPAAARPGACLDAVGQPDVEGEGKAVNVGGDGALGAEEELDGVGSGEAEGACAGGYLD